LKESSSKEDKKYMFFKTALSLYRDTNQLKMVKAFILDTAFKNDYQVEWLFVSNRINQGFIQ
jgi:hypothetical protein